MLPLTAVGPIFNEIAWYQRQRCPLWIDPCCCFLKMGGVAERAVHERSLKRYLCKAMDTWHFGSFCWPSHLMCLQEEDVAQAHAPDAPDAPDARPDLMDPYQPYPPYLHTGNRMSLQRPGDRSHGSGSVSWRCSDEETLKIAGWYDWREMSLLVLFIMCSFCVFSVLWMPLNFLEIPLCLDCPCHDNRKGRYAHIYDSGLFFLIHSKISTDHRLNAHSQCGSHRSEADGKWWIPLTEFN